MGLKAIFARLATGAPVPVFVLSGVGGRKLGHRLALDEAVEVVDSPRAAQVLVIVGRLPEALWAAARQVHDQLPPTRSTVVWAEEPCPALPEATFVALHDDPIPVVTLSSGGEGHILADEDPNQWRGIGPYGQGGKGMTGGTPYGRPLTGRAEDRDGLQLDQLAVTVGPFFPPMPPGLVMHIKLQGDVVQEAIVGDNPFVGAEGAPGSSVGGGEMGLFERALTEPVAVADLELARARHHLWWLGDALHVQGLTALGERAWRLAARLALGDREAVGRLTSAVRRSQVLRWSVDGVAPIDGSVLAGKGLGPVARAAGCAEDARQLDPAYQAIGFDLVVQNSAGADCADRWRQRLVEIDQALDLARRAGDSLTTPVGVVEAPRGTVSIGGRAPASALVDLVDDLVKGLEWGDAVAAIGSLDLDMEEAARTGATTARP